MSNKSRRHPRTNQPRHPQLRRQITAAYAVFGGALAASFIAIGTASATPTDLDPFEDLLPAGSTAAQIAGAQADDAALAAANPALAAQLDAGVDDGTITFAGADLDPHQDLFGVNLPGIFLDTNVPAPIRAFFDPIFDKMLMQPGFPAPPDVDAFSDFGFSNGPTLDKEYPMASGQLDPLVDKGLGEAGATPPPADADPMTDLAQAFDPTGFNANGAPVDFIAQVATQLDAVLLPTGLGLVLDPVADDIISGFGITGSF